MVLLDVYGADGSLFVNGVPLSIKGVNWFGSESYGGPPGGLTVHTIDFYLDFLQEHKFNALRLLFNHQTALHFAATCIRADRSRLYLGLTLGQLAASLPGDKTNARQVILQLLRDEP